MGKILWATIEHPTLVNLIPPWGASTCEKIAPTPARRHYGRAAGALDDFLAGLTGGACGERAGGGWSWKSQSRQLGGKRET